MHRAGAMAAVSASPPTPADMMVDAGRGYRHRSMARPAVSPTSTGDCSATVVPQMT